MNQLIEHVLKTNVGWNVISVLKTSVLGSDVGLNRVLHVGYQAIGHRVRFMNLVVN